MKERDVWLVGLLALTYLYLDAAAPRGRIRVQAPAEPYLPPEPPAPPLPDFSADACPRDATHSVSLRPDGAMWCLGCDEGFFPVEMVM